MSTLIPAKVSVLAYHVGFGDCLLVRFHYPDRCRHVLIDFGTTSRPVGTPKDQMAMIAASIRDECAGKLDALVATHRHADHIGGFSTEQGPGSTGSIIAGLHPDLVVQPWTEDPEAVENATGPTAGFMAALPGLDERALLRGRGFVGKLDAACNFLSRIDDWVEPASKLGIDGAVFRNVLLFLGEVGLKNASAVDNLVQIGKTAQHGSRYVYFGADSGFDAALLPGVKVTVLGPPTLDQTQAIRTQAIEDQDEFWMLTRFTGTPLADGYTSGPTSAEDDVPPYARWLKRKLDALGIREQLEFVRQLDQVLNNTSVILLFEVGFAKLLFPGDAQIENWRYALQQAGVKKLLEDVNVYKVGHHGSRNATPKTLWYGFKRRSQISGSPGRLITVLSTQHGKHGSTLDHTEVPRETLVDELALNSEFFNTEEASGGVLYTEVEIKP